MALPQLPLTPPDSDFDKVADPTIYDVINNNNWEQTGDDLIDASTEFCAIVILAGYNCKEYRDWSKDGC